MSTHHYILKSPLGPLTLVATEQVLTGLYFPDHPHAPAAESFGTALSDADLHGAEVLTLSRDQVREYFAGKRRDFDLPLAPQGTEFQHRVWAALRDIPFGQTRSYGEIAKTIEAPKASRAVGMANGRNPLAIIVPCHRVIGSDGSITGYSGGQQRKRELLERERSQEGASPW